MTAAEKLRHHTAVCGELHKTHGLLDEAAALLDACEDGFRYILGDDIAGYDAHMQPKEVAAKVLARLRGES